MIKIFRNIVGGVCLAAMASCGGSQDGATSSSNATTGEYANSTIETIMQRRSIRKYKLQTVSRDTLQLIAECGINAPNAMNRQSWEVRIVDNPDTMAKIKDLMAKGKEGEDAERAKGCFRDAPVMTFIARDRESDFAAYDCALLAENMMIAAQSLGVGSICLGSPVSIINSAENSEEILQILGFSPEYKLCLCVGLGYADEAPEARERDAEKVKFVD